MKAKSSRSKALTLPPIPHPLRNRGRECDALKPRSTEQAAWQLLHNSGYKGALNHLRACRSPKMKPDKDMKLADLMYGHGDRFICHLSGRFDPEKYSDAPPIQICEMKCGCWVVADGNNRVGLILRKNPEATLADIPNKLLSTAQFGEWDNEMMDWWNPCAKSFREVMTKRDKHIPKPKDQFTE